MSSMHGIEVVSVCCLHDVVQPNPRGADVAFLDVHMYLIEPRLGCSSAIYPRGDDE